MVMELSNFTRIFKALANEQRLRIFMIIYNQCCLPAGEAGKGVIFADQGCCPAGRSFQKAFTSVCNCLNLSRSTVSHHFKELQNAGLITCEREGQAFRCSVNEEALTAIREFLNNAPTGQC